MNSLLKIIAGIILLIGIVLLGIFVYNKYRYTPSVPVPVPTPTGALPYNPLISEEEKMKSFAEDFVRIYKTYQVGDYSGIESLKDRMTSRLWQEKSEWIANAKLQSENQPKRYITYSAFLKNTVIIFDDKDRAEIEVNYIQSEMRGAMIQGEITTRYVNEFGEDKPIPPPVELPGKIRVRLIKENNEWKVDRAE